ncbi:MAG: dCMP deaminase family protein [Candidatus Omnitrophica bacterium]|nr:dCMP deaminase family protein [Candidatus Omnitrophota bacterium]MDD5488183.1 dCMP deaminase family protein [Candidatus Omnitrophota bacterium]
MKQKTSVTGKGPKAAGEHGKKRPSWDEYFLSIAGFVATRSTCLRRQVGAVVVKNKQILATGYNGAPSGLRHCAEIGCMRQELGVPSGERHELCRALHAEQNAFLQAARHGVSLEGATLYITNQPCSICAKMIINVGIGKIVIEGDYPDEFARQFIQESGIEMVVMGK